MAPSRPCALPGPGGPSPPTLAWGFPSFTARRCRRASLPARRSDAGNGCLRGMMNEFWRNLRVVFGDFSRFSVAIWSKSGLHEPIPGPAGQRLLPVCRLRKPPGRVPRATPGRVRHRAGGGCARDGMQRAEPGSRVVARVRLKPERCDPAHQRESRLCYEVPAVVAARRRNHLLTKWYFSQNWMVARDGIEPSTRGFSVRCSTN